MKIFKTTLVLVPSVISFCALANVVDDASQVQDKTNATSITSQSKIDKSVDHSKVLASDIDQLSQEIKNLTVYKKHLTDVVANQQDEMTSINQQIADIKQTRQGLVPLMYDMLDGLQDIIDNSKPIKLEQRKQRLAALRKLMPQADVSDAEKYRRILEAYQIELDYGNKLESYRSSITLAGGKQIEADIFYFGKAVLVARSLDQSEFWTWDRKSSQWINGDSSDLDDVNKAFAIANQKDTPSLLTLPVSMVAEGK